MPLAEKLQDPFEEFKNGDPRALNALFNLYYAPLCLFADRMIKDRPAAEDIVGEAFVKLWSRHRDFENLQNIKAFLYITTRNACLNLLKQMQRESLSKKQLAYISGGQEGFVLNDMIRNEVLTRIKHEIENLPEQCRKIFKMSYFEGRKNQEIAELLRISVHTVKNQKARAIQLLKVKLPNRTLAAMLMWCISLACIAGF